MKTKITLILFVTSIFIISTTFLTYADVWVRGYYRKDGTYVRGHWRSDPDGNPYNNWSFPGNINPHTGKIATGNPSTYLKNYYGWKYTYELYRSYYNDEQFNNWLEDNKDNEQFAEWLSQYEKEQEKLRDDRIKRLSFLFFGLAIGYIASLNQ